MPGTYSARLGLFETLGLSAMPLAAATAGIVADLLDRDIPLVYIGCGAALTAVALVLAGTREVRDFLDWEAPADAAEPEAPVTPPA